MKITEGEIKDIQSIFGERSDELTFVLRSHLFIEGVIDEVIISKLPRGKKIVSDKAFTFFHKLKLIRAMGFLRKEEYQAIIDLNELRNKFAHKMKYKVEKEDIDHIGSLFPNRYEEIKKEYSMEEKVAHPKGGHETRNLILEFTLYNLLGYVYRIGKEYS